jgi:hypothetical protein
MSDELHLELLAGRVVRDVGGVRAGRLWEILATKENDEIVVLSYLIGPSAWLQRFAVHAFGLRLRSIAWFQRVPWDRMDLSDPRHPRLTCRRTDLPVEYLRPRRRQLTRRPGRRVA